MGDFEKKLKSYRAENGLNQSEMADLIGVGFRTYQEIEKSGEIKKAEVLTKVTHILAQSLASQPEEPYHTKRLKRKNESSSADVPVFNGSTSLGNITMYNDERKEVIATLPANVFPGCDYAEKASGDSMYPIIMNQAWLVGKKCGTSGITYGEKYIIKTKDGLDTTKFVHPGKKKETLILVAHNKSIPSQEIHIADIIFSCRVKWIINPT
jgi:DNA-binding XRE family transcriptional regulator